MSEPVDKLLCGGRWLVTGGNVRDAQSPYERRNEGLRYIGFDPVALQTLSQWLCQPSIA
jgi:hypothetical protein